MRRLQVVPTPPPATRPPLTDWRSVQPGVAYDAADVAALFGVTPPTIHRWAQSGLLFHLPRLTPRQPLRFLGSELLRLLGSQGAALSGPSETPSQRAARGEAAARRVRELAAGRPG